MTVLYNFKNTYTAVAKAAKSAFTLVSVKPPLMNLFHIAVSLQWLVQSPSLTNGLVITLYIKLSRFRGNCLLCP